ncbi:glycosyl hydrolase family 8 [Roseomonas sp. GC11]|uniref:glycosyl hydrolase family 8 n=1 Tax=Roseomonas sp. GC11 TaxID=2950546 RepID=UPI00210E1F39|nr:glycosyl hydrolase family 8 [Roseomonas sp. GC11]MCQ4163027.1 glycosyl hydrolase family 8 [Roseomonas sp. GC11]
MSGAFGRRSLLALSTLMLAATPRLPGHAEIRSAPTPTGLEQWEEFKQRFIAPIGRVVDTGNKDCSHSEGQGWGLLLAASFDDQAAFDRILSWTRAELRRPYDSLTAWSWKPNRARPVEDSNNATDGDLFIAWALARAGRRWGRPALVEEARAILRDLDRLCVREVDGRPVLLPAAFGFEHPGYLVVNPSYYVFPAFPALAQLHPQGRWMALYEGGLDLLRQARFGRWGLPADWVRLASGERPKPAWGWPPRFSYDAIRVPLYLNWAGLGEEPAARAALSFWTAFPQSGMPAWTDFRGDSIAPYTADPGMRAVALLVADPEARTTDLPAVRLAPHYYAAALTLLSRLAAFERPPQV